MPEQLAVAQPAPGWLEEPLHQGRQVPGSVRGEGHRLLGGSHDVRVRVDHGTLASGFYNAVLHITVLGHW